MMKAFKTATVAASAVLAISSRLFPTESYNNLITLMLDDKMVIQGSVSEYNQEMRKWSGLRCTPIKTDLVPIPWRNSDDAIDEGLNGDLDIYDDDVIITDLELGWSLSDYGNAPFLFNNLRWTEFVGVSDEPVTVDGCLTNLKKAIISCFGLDKQD